YESLFASNVVLSRRPDSQRPDAGQSRSAPLASPRAATDPAMPSIDDIADAAVRASLRANGAPSPVTAIPNAAATAASRQIQDRSTAQRPTHTDPINNAGPLHRILEGTIIDAVLTNRVDGGSAAPVNCLVTNPVYSHSGQQVVIPAGARLLGETRPVQTFGETRL